MQTLYISPGGSLNGVIRVPGDKSISHRAVMFAAIAQGTTQVDGFLDGEDCLATLNVFRQLGVEAKQSGTSLTIQGAGLRGLTAPLASLDCGNSGTSMRLLAGLLSAQAFDSELIGDASLQSRPMRRVTDPLGQMGAKIETMPEGTAPLSVTGGQVLRGIHYHSPVASAQIKSAILLAGLYADGETVIHEPGPSRDHTERMLSAFGHTVSSRTGSVAMAPATRLEAVDITVPGDISSAAFFLVGASIAPGSDLLIEGVGMNPTRTGVLDVLWSMGADIQVENERDQGGEPVADLHVRHAELSGVEIDGDVVARAIDEFPALFIAAACAQGNTRLREAAELRVKESDRIAVMAAGLQQLGIAANPTEDGMEITGGEFQMNQDIVIDGHGDHRIAMAFAMAGLRSTGSFSITNCAAINTSFPGFATLVAQAGSQIKAI